MKWLSRIVVFLLLLTLTMTVFGRNIGPIELLVLPVLIVLVMWGCSRLVRLGRQA